MLTAEEARKAVAKHAQREREAVETLARTIFGQIEQNIKRNAGNGYNSSTYHTRTAMFRRQEVEETVTKWLAEAGYEIEVNNEKYIIRW